MLYDRDLELGSKGEDVFYIKQKLFKLGYYNNNITRISSKTYGKDTVYAVKNYQTTNNLEVTGTINEVLWDIIDNDNNTIKEDGIMEYTRQLSKGMSGEDVFYIKKLLFEREYFAARITKISSKTYGSDTVVAVKNYQSTNNLVVDGIIGEKTWNSIVSSDEVRPVETHDVGVDTPENISQKASEKILADLATVNSTRQEIVAELLKYAVDLNDLPKYMISFYIRGGNLFNQDLTVNTMSSSKLTSYFSRADYAPYYDNGRKEVMLAAAQAANFKITGADCSGGVVGILRYFKKVKASFDSNANSLCGNSHSTAITKAELLPGDWVGRDGHIGVYVGGGYVVEWVGGAYGCQLTVLNSRYVYNFQTKKKQKYSDWTKFRRPKYY